MMWPLVTSLVLAMSGTVLTFNPANIRCCECTSMFPEGIGSTKPQVAPSPFKIVVDPAIEEYTSGKQVIDISVNLTSMFAQYSFRKFMIQARRINTSLDILEPIGEFTVLEKDPANATALCLKRYGSALVSTDSSKKQLVQLAWKPPKSFQGHIEFRASFVEDEQVFWVKEKSRPLYDPTIPRPAKQKSRYIPPPIRGIEVENCGTTKGCYRIPKGCQEIGCEYLLTWNEIGDSVEFEMSTLTDGYNDRYLALGLSEDIYMGGELVFECVHNSSSGITDVYQSMNAKEGNKNKRLDNPKVGIWAAEGSYNNGRLRCRFKRRKDVDDPEVGDFPITAKNWHLLLARGTAWKGQIHRHDLTVGHLPVATPDEVNLQGYDNVSGRARYHLVKAHACLMLLAWVFFAPVGLIWMKYYTTMWPNRRFLGEKYWVTAHFNCTFWVVLLVIIGFILIFIEAGGYSNYPDLPGRAHPILGIIVFCCVLLIPIIALIRCPEDHTCRPVANWFYWLFWTIAFCLAIPNIFIGMEFGKAHVPWWLTWILCIFFIFNLVCEVILEVHQCCTHKKNKERRKKYELQKKENPKAHIPEPHPAGRIFKRNVLLTHFIVSLIVVLIAVITVAAS